MIYRKTVSWGKFMSYITLVKMNFIWIGHLSIALIFTYIWHPKVLKNRTAIGNASCYLLQEKWNVHVNHSLLEIVLFCIYYAYNDKPFWKYIKSKRQDARGIAPLKKGANLISDSKGKAELLLNQFKSVFTKTTDNTKDKDSNKNRHHPN